MNYFLEIYGTLPRAGPGSDALTIRALDLIKQELPHNPHILDLGCGPGRQTIELLNQTAGTVVALDFLPHMLGRLKDYAKSEGVLDRLELVQQDMKTMSFPAETFDMIWSEGAIYILGFENGLKAVKPLVKPGGFVCVSEVVWLKEDPSPEIVEFWQEYPEIDSIKAKLNVIHALGYEVVDHFTFPPEAWLTHYYQPMAQQIEKKAVDWRGNEEAEAVLNEARREIEMFKKYHEFYTYAFFVMRKPLAIEK